MPEVHVRVKVNGAPEKVKLFHMTLYALDSDWPYAGSQHIRDTRTMECKKCKGLKYNNPKMAAQDLKRFASQMGVKLKVKQFSLATKCRDNCGVSGFTLRSGSNMMSC